MSATPPHIVSAATTPGAGWWHRLPLWVRDGLGLLARLILAAVWLASGLLKAVDPIQTRLAVKAYQLLPNSLATVVGDVLPYAEIAVGLILLFGIATRLGAILSLLLLVAFIIGVSSAAARGLSIDCGCFGGGGQVSAGATEYTWEIVRDSLLLLVALYLAIRPASLLGIDRLARRGDAQLGEQSNDSTDGTTS